MKDPCCLIGLQGLLLYDQTKENQLNQTKGNQM